MDASLVGDQETRAIRSDQTKGIQSSEDEAVGYERAWPNERLCAVARSLAAQLRQASYSVFLWGEDEFTSTGDQLLVNRLLEIARLLSQTNRSSLLMLDSDAGKPTAHETLLWLTNLAPTAHHDGTTWRAVADSARFTLDDWQRRYDCIVGVRSLPCDRPWPNLDFALLIDTVHATAPLSGLHASKRVSVASVGIGAGGQLLRTDHGQMCYLPPLGSSTANVAFSNDGVDQDRNAGALVSSFDKQEWTAAEVLADLAERVAAEKELAS